MNNYQSIFDSFADATILVIGDVMVDSYLWGKVERISPEAPVPIVSVEKREDRLGGAANVALNIKSLGATPILCSIIGDDEKGGLFLSLLKKQGMTTRGIIADENRKTTSKTRIISGNQHCLRIDDEITSDISAMQSQLLLSKAEEIIQTSNINAIIFEDYDKGVITKNIIAPTVKLAKEKGIVVCVDPKKKNFLEYKGVSLFKPNFKELCEGLKIEVAKNNFKAIFEAVHAYQKQMNIEHVMVTLSELGMMITDDDTYHHVPTHIREVADVSGAGDTVISVATLCKAAGLPSSEIARISNIAGGLVCEHAGVVSVDKAQLLHEISKQ